MADEITATSGLVVNKTNGPKFTIPTNSQRITLAGSRFSAGIQDIGTGSHEALTVIADQTTAGWAHFKNLDATNYVEIGVDVSSTFGPLIRLDAGEECTVHITTKNVYAKANTGAIKLQYEILEP